MKPRDGVERLGSMPALLAMGGREAAPSVALAGLKLARVSVSVIAKTMVRDRDERDVRIVWLLYVKVVARGDEALSYYRKMEEKD
jgi:hypothetical protein